MAEARTPTPRNRTEGDHVSVQWLRKIFVAIVMIFALFYLFTRPEDAAAAVRNVFIALSHAFNSIIVFFTSLAG